MQYQCVVSNYLCIDSTSKETASKKFDEEE